MNNDGRGISMRCRECGGGVPDGLNHCPVCGAEQPPAPEGESGKGRGRKGFSDRIHDPAFKKYIRDGNRWSAYFAGGLAVIAIVGFTVAGEMGWDNMENPEALYIGLGVGGMFIAIALLQIMGRRKSKTWDGVVADKTVTEKRRKKKDDEGRRRWEYYTEYKVVIKADDGGDHHIINENNSVVYDYYKIGDRVRHHGGLKSYEKYDKSNDSIVFCNACGSLWDIEDDACRRCGCPLLK